MAAARIAGAAVVFGVDCLGEDDHPLLAKLFHQDVVARREVDIIAASPPPVDRMSLVSKGSLNEKTTPHIGIASTSGLRPLIASSSAARSIAAGCRRKISQTGGAPGGSGPSSRCRSKSPRQVTDCSPGC
jgi:hypothetical protein